MNINKLTRCMFHIIVQFFDAYFGLSYLAQLFVKDDKVAPSDIYQEAFDRLFSGGSVSADKPTHNKEEIELLGHSGRQSSRSVHSATSLNRRR